MLRTLESFQHHLTDVVAACRTHWILLQRQTLLGLEYITLARPCQSQYCPDCRRVYLRQIRRSITDGIKGRRWRLVTLTYPDHTADRLVTLKGISRQFKLLIHYTTRRYPGLQYIRSIELHKSGMPHIHMIVDRYIPQAFIVKAWHDLGGGHVNVVSTRKCPVCSSRGPCIHNPHPKPLSYQEAAFYLTEEIEKAAQDPHRLGVIYWLAHVRSLTTSRAIKLRPRNSEYHFAGLFDSRRAAEDAVLQLNALQAVSDHPRLGLKRLRSLSVIAPGVSSELQTSSLPPTIVSPPPITRNDHRAYDVSKAPPIPEHLRR
jgi:hypothetical protein